jgi:lauroyl/myristoyl acyltransferase
MHRPGGWRPLVRIEGAEHIDTALRAGKGAVLWIARDPYGSNMVAMMALAQAGYRTTHLGRAGHGFGGARVQRRYLNRLVTRAEAPYISGRVVITQRQTVGPMRALRARLAANGLVSIVALPVEARGMAEVALEGETWRFPTGPATLAARAGAPLLPMFSVKERTGRFRVVIEDPLPLAHRPGSETNETFRTYAALLRKHGGAAGGFRVPPGQRHR